jgi:hypothetical protein
MTQPTPTTLPNGPVAAAILSCGFGCFFLGVLAVAADASKPLAAALNFCNPAGPLSGVTTVAIALWLLCWAMLGARWKRRHVQFARVGAFASLFLALGLLLTFPPIGDLSLGR